MHIENPVSGQFLITHGPDDVVDGGVAPRHEKRRERDPYLDSFSAFYAPPVSILEGIASFI